MLLIFMSMPQISTLRFFLVPAVILFTVIAPSKLVLDIKQPNEKAPIKESFMRDLYIKPLNSTM
jgi:hypothetical protein